MKKHFWPRVDVLVKVAQDQLSKSEKAVFHGDEA
jgi:hypothetical protein